MSKMVKVTLYTITRDERSKPLSETLLAFGEMPLQQRARSLVRLESVEVIPAKDGLPELWCLDFAKGRETGPGKMSFDKAVSDIALDADEHFGEETAAIYIPKNQWLVILNNRYGVGPSQMAQYFSSLDPDDRKICGHYIVAPMIDRSAMKKMKAAAAFSSIEVNASIGAFDCGDKIGESVLEAAKGATAHRLHLKLIANEKNKRGNTLSSTAVRHLVDKLLGKGEDIDSIRVQVADDFVEKQDKVIDLIEHKVSRFYSANDLIIENHRYNYDSKVALLRRACKGWLDSIG